MSSDASVGNSHRDRRARLLGRGPTLVPTPAALVPSGREFALIAEHDPVGVASFYESIFGGVTDGIIVQDRDGTLVHANLAAAREVGFPSVASFLSTPTKDLRDRIELYDESGEPLTFEDLPGFLLLRGLDLGERLVRFRFAPSGKEVWTSVNSVPVRDGAGQIDLVVSTFRDVTDRKVAEEERARLAAIFEYSNDAIITKTADGIVETWNPAAERLFGYTAEEVVGKSVTILVRRDQVEERKRFLDAIRNGKRIERSETEWVGKDGRRVDVSVSVSPIRDVLGRITGAATIARDVGDRMRLEGQFRQAQKLEAVGRLAGGVAHDFNNLVTVISGFSELLLMQLTPGDPRRDLVEEIARAGERATALTRQLLVFSRRQVVSARELNLNEIVTEAEKMLRRLIGEDINLVSMLDPNLGRIKADSGQMEQVVVNLIVNARDAMPQGGKLTIETSNVDLDEWYAREHLQVRPGPYVVLRVTDTGVGMDPETQTHIFEPFFTTKPVEKGTGLGLSTVHGIITQSGGHIGVYSELGMGTSFKIYLPRIDTKAVQSDANTTHPEPTGGSETVLLVEDDDMVRSLVQQVLESHGYQVLETRNGEEAQKIANEFGRRIHLLVTDVVLPGLGGKLVAERLTKLRPTMKVLFLSGYGENAIVRHGMLQPGSAFLEKPFVPSVLVRIVREVLDLPSPSQNGRA